MTKDEWKSKYDQEGISDEFGVNDWGSCQYSGALNFFNIFFKMRENLSHEEVLEVMNISVKFDSILDFLTAKEGLIENIRENYDDEELKEHGQEIIDRINKALKPEHLFIALRKSSYDLWGAAPAISHEFFAGLEITNVPKAPGKGPELNQIVQSYNYETGLYCALLVDYGIIVDQSCFVDFDT